MSVSEPRAEDMRMDLGALLGAVLSRWLRILLVTVLLLAATFAVLMFVPKLYESSASLLVEQRSNIFTRAQDGQAVANALSIDALMSSQIELIKSRDTFLSVIDELDLRSEPEFSGAGVSPIGFVLQLIGRKPEPRSIDETVLENMNQRITVLRERDSAVISIYVRSEDPELAARMANAIADAHVRRRAALSLSDTAEASGWLQQEIDKLRRKVADAENAVANYRVDNDLVQMQTGSSNSTIVDQQLSNIATQVTSATERKNSALTRANLIRGLLDGGQPIDGVADVRNSLVIQNLTQSRAALMGELAQRSSTLLSNHPTIKALRAQIRAIEGQIADEGRRVAEALEAEAKVEANLEQKLNDDLTRLKQSASTATRDTVTLESLQREAKAQRDLLESYLARYSDATARTDSSSALPDVRVVNAAAPATSPASPKTALILGAVGFIAIALQVGTILFGELMSGRAITTRRGYAAPIESEPTAEQELEPDLFDTATAVDADAVDQPVIAELPVLSPEPDEVDNKFDDVTEPPLTVEDVPVEPEDDAEFEPMPEFAPSVQARAAGSSALELSNLSADIAIGRVRVVMLAALDDFSDVEAVAETLVVDALHRGLSVTTIDAGSGRPSVEPGLTDLASEQASFGDVVHKVSDGLAAVPWGHQEKLERRSMRPVTLIEALTDIYEVVIVTTGRLGVTSALPVFSGVDCRLVLVTGGQSGSAAVQTALNEAASLGYDVGQLVAAPPQRSVA